MNWPATGTYVVRLWRGGQWLLRLVARVWVLRRRRRCCVRLLSLSRRCRQRRSFSRPLLAAFMRHRCAVSSRCLRMRARSVQCLAVCVSEVNDKPPILYPVVLLTHTHTHTKSALRHHKNTTKKESVLHVSVKRKQCHENIHQPMKMK